LQACGYYEQVVFISLQLHVQRILNKNLLLFVYMNHGEALNTGAG
jgi:hypothetical protein